jgi:hypothetical protein
MKMSRRQGYFHTSGDEHVERLSRDLDLPARTV